MKIITLEVGNTSWWKNRKYRREASLELKKLRKKYKSIKLIKKYRIKKYFLLDVEFPFIYNASNNGEKNISIRFSEKESIETVKNFINKVNYVWIDTFTKFPINKNNLKILNKFHNFLFFE